MAVDPGWYPDGSGQLRYWDGNAWTEHTHPLPAAAPAQAVAAEGATQQAQQVAAPWADPGEQPRRPLSGGRVAALIGAGVLALAGIGLMLVPVVGGLLDGPSGATVATGERIGSDDEPAGSAGSVDGEADPGAGEAMPVDVGDIDASSTPDDVAIAYAAAWWADDCLLEHALSSEDLTWGIPAEEYCEGIEPTEDGPVLVAAVVAASVIDGEVATVTLEETVDWGDDWTDTSSTVYTLAVTDEGWRVSSFEWLDLSE